MSRQVNVDTRSTTDSNELGEVHELSPMLAYQRMAIVNVVYFGSPGAGDRNWVLVDTGVHGSSAAIRRAAAARFGEDARPAAIILTHGHFDHVGAARDLAEQWETPIYAHELEMPYLDGRSKYPAPDPNVGGGLMASLARFYPRGPVDLGPWLKTLSPHEVPGMNGWQWLETPGHTPGHISLWNEAQRTLVAGDAFITTKQESAYAVFSQRPEMHGPPQYYTPDWAAARTSVERLATLQPELAVTGHGPAMHGSGLREGLLQLAEQFDRVAVPARDR